MLSYSKLLHVFGIFLVPSGYAAIVPIQERSLHNRASFNGEATYFNVGLGACGKMNVDSDFIVALATPTYAQGSHCDERIEIADPTTGKSATATVRDACPGCSATDLDMSPALFEHFQPLTKGRFNNKLSNLVGQSESGFSSHGIPRT